MLVDFRGTEMTGKRAQELLDRVGITANKNSVPYDERPPADHFGPAAGHSGHDHARASAPRRCAKWPRSSSRRSPATRPRQTLDRLLARSRALTAAFPLYRTLGA